MRQDARADMLGPEAQAQHTGGQACERGEPLQQPQQKWRIQGLGAAEHATDHVVLYPHLQPLRPARWRLAPRLHAGQIGVRHMAGAERHGQQIRRRHRVLDREVDADAADGRHGMSCVADAEQPRPVPSPETVHANGQQLEIIEALDFSRAPLEERRQLFEIVLECGDAPLADVGEGALGDDIAALPVVAAVDHDEDMAEPEAANRLIRIARGARKPEPEHVHGRASILRGEACLGARHGVPPVAANDELGQHAHRAIGGFGDHAADFAFLLDEFGRLGFHQQLEAGIGLRFLREKIEEIPLRHQCYEFRARGQMRKVGECRLHRAEPAAQRIDLVMGQPEQPLVKAKLVHELQRRGVQGIAAKIAQEIGVLFEDGHGDARARQQIARHHARRAAAHDAAAGRQIAHSWNSSFALHLSKIAARDCSLLRAALMLADAQLKPLDKQGARSSCLQPAILGGAQSRAWIEPVENGA